VAVVPVQVAPADRGAAQVDLGVVPAGNVANAPDLRKAAPTDHHPHPDLMARPQAAPMDRRHRLAPMGPLPLTDNVAPAAPDSAGPVDPVDPVAPVAPVVPVGLVAGADPVSTQIACSLTPWNSTPTKTAA
jgi:hypothetical protein